MASTRTIIIETKRLMKRRRLLIGGLISLLLLGFVLFTNHGVIMRLRLESERQKFTKEIEQAQTRGDSLRKQVYILKTDTLEIERLARQNYGLIKPGEEVYFVEPK